MTKKTSVPASITPDSKDWTWVLTSTCPDCQLTAAAVSPETIAGRIPDQVAQWQQTLTRPDVAVRPSPETWSPLEYACHIRDVYGLFETRSRLILDHDGPTFADWDQDEAAVAGAYWEAAPDDVARDLATAAASYAKLLQSVPNDAWGRVGLRSNGSEFTLATLTQYFLHDITHHLWDVGFSGV